MEEKRNYIYNNIDNVQDHANIITIINQSNCRYTQNNNGIFVNLNTLSEEIIDQIYFLLNSELNFSDVTDNVYENTTEMYEIETEIKEKPQIKKPVKNISINDFSQREKDIINYSKLYNLK